MDDLELQYGRDPHAKGLYLKDMKLAARYEMEMSRANAEKVRDQEINTLKSELSEIKAMLAQMLNRGQNG
jgi:hypothetical protein